MVHKANQIALFFESYSYEEAVKGVGDHLLKFWEPRMRRQIVAYVEGGGAGLRPSVVDAVRGLPAVPATQ